MTTVIFCVIDRVMVVTDNSLITYLDYIDPIEDFSYGSYTKISKSTTTY